jgi:hypothetical protein
MAGGVGHQGYLDWKNNYQDCMTKILKRPIR